MNNNLYVNDNYYAIATGSGLITLDIIINNKKNKYLTLCVGGSCGNVLLILSFFNWLSYPIAYIGKDVASHFLLKDLLYWGIKTNFIYRNDNVSTPLIIERIFKNKSITHKFEFKCPLCNTDLPRNRVIPEKYSKEIINKMPPSQIFYFDRISKTIIEIAKIQKRNGALIFFEPYKISKKRLFSKCLEISHIVKYSGEQIDKIPYDVKIPLEIKTLGALGLKYNLNIKDKKGKWIKLNAYNHNKIIDSAGSGDWCTAGIIHMLGQHGYDGFIKSSNKYIEKAIKFGQYLASINCKYEGARGTMYNMHNPNFKKIDKKDFFNKEILKQNTKKGLVIKNFNYLRYLCPSCNKKLVKNGIFARINNRSINT